MAYTLNYAHSSFRLLLKLSEVEWHIPMFAFYLCMIYLIITNNIICEEQKNYASDLIILQSLVKVAQDSN